MLLNNDIIEFNIIPYLYINAIYNLAKVNKQLYKIFLSDIWRYLLQRDFKLEKENIAKNAYEQYIYLNNKFKISTNDSFEIIIKVKSIRDPLLYKLLKIISILKQMIIIIM